MKNDIDKLAEVGDTAYYYELDGENGVLYTIDPIWTVATKLIFTTVSADTKLGYEFKFNAESAIKRYSR